MFKFDVHRCVTRYDILHIQMIEHLQNVLMTRNPHDLTLKVSLNIETNKFVYRAKISSLKRVSNFRFSV